MANSGIKQATIAYKVTRPGGVPLDIDGNPISVSGKRQAIALLSGRENPDPAVYEVETYFTEGSAITGNPTQQYDPVTCPVGFLFLNPDMVVLTPDNPVQTVVLFSVNPWSVVSGPNIATLVPTTGATGSYAITVTRTETLGQGAFIFRDNVTLQTVSLYVVNTTDPTTWILDDGIWNMMQFWFNDGIWNF